VIITNELFQFIIREDGSFRMVLGSPRYPGSVLSFVGLSHSPWSCFN